MFGRPFATPLVRRLVNSPVSPVHLSLLAFAAGLAAALWIARGSHAAFVAGAVLLQVKNILDTADGHLARARGKPSYVGRFLDSLVDFVVNVASHAALAVALVRRDMPPPAAWTLAALASVSSFVQVSTYVYYTVTYLHRVGRNPLSRTSERAAPPEGGEGGREPPWLVRLLHRIHVVLYGWQDELVARIDRTAFARLARRLGVYGLPDDERDLARFWYDDRPLLARLSVLGLGTQLAAMSLALVLNLPMLYLALAIAGGNAYLLGLYPVRAASTRRAWRKRDLPHQAGSFLGEPPPP